MGLFAALRLPDGPEFRRLATRVGLVMILLLAAKIADTAVKEFYFYYWARLSSHVHWQVAEGLNAMGMRPGDKVALIWGREDPFWARLGRVQIVADIASNEAPYFWAADSALQSRVLQTLARAGCRLVVTEHIPPHVSTIGWRRVAGTTYFARFLP